VRTVTNFITWFFPPTDRRTLALFRIGSGLVTLAFAGTWLSHLQAFFSNEGYAQAAYVQVTTPYSHYSLFFFNDSYTFVKICYALLVVSCLALIVGYASRLASILVYILFVSFTSRFPLLIYGGSEVLHFLLFFSMFLPYAPFIEQFKKITFWPAKVTSVEAWGIRMIQLNLAIVYFFAGISKFRSAGWFQGTELGNSLMTRFGIYGPGPLLHFPILNNILTYGTLALEISAPFLLFPRSTRRTWLLSLVGMHFGILLLMNASYFSEIMFVALVSFITTEDWEAMKDLPKYLKKLKRSTA
jgi:hypothetical protein